MGCPRRLRSPRDRMLVMLVVVAFALGLTVVAVYGPGFRGRTADLDWLANKLPQLHKNLYFRLPEAEYRQALAELGERADRLDREQYFVALSEILAAVGDGHTGVRLPYDVQQGYGRYPLELYWFEDGLYVIRAGTELAGTVGSRVAAIEGKPLDEVMERVAAMIPKENDVSVLVRSPDLLVRPEVLYGLGVAEHKDRASFTLEQADGGEIEVKLQTSASKPFAWSPPTVTRPLWLSHASVIWHRYLEADRMLYIQYNSCQGDLEQATRAIVAVLDSEPVEKIVFDVRRNGGGNSLVARGLINTIAARPEVSEPGHLFVVVGRGTFSSAILNSYDFRRRTNAIFVGEPTAGKPNCYGEVKTARLPHSKLTVQYSIKYFELVKAEDPPSFMPDIVIEQDAESYFAGRDPVLEAILEYGHGGPR